MHSGRQTSRGVKRGMHDRVPVLDGTVTGRPLRLKNFCMWFQLFCRFASLKRCRVVLVHLDLIREVAAQDLGEDPAVGQVTLRVLDLVRQVQRLDPNVNFSRQRGAKGRGLRGNFKFWHACSVYE